MGASRAKESERSAKFSRCDALSPSRSTVSTESELQLARCTYNWAWMLGCASETASEVEQVSRILQAQEQLEAVAIRELGEYDQG